MAINPRKNEYELFMIIAQVLVTVDNKKRKKRSNRISKTIN